MESNEENKKNNGGIDLSRLINKEYLIPLGDFYKCSICSKIMINPSDSESCVILFVMNVYQNLIVHLVAKKRI